MHREEMFIVCWVATAGPTPASRFGDGSSNRVRAPRSRDRQSGAPARRTLLLTVIAGLGAHTRHATPCNKTPRSQGETMKRAVRWATLSAGLAGLVSRVRTKSCPMAFDLPRRRTAEFHAGGQVISGLG